MNKKFLLKFVPAAAMLCATGFMAQAAAVTETAAVSPSQTSQRNAVRPLDIQEGETIFSYAPDGTYRYWGLDVIDIYDMAIRITDPVLVGARIEGIRFELKMGEGVEDVCGWTSATLDGIPTGETVYVSTVQAGWNEVRFAAPVEIPSSGIYVGYSLTVAQLVSDGENGYVIGLGASKQCPNAHFLRSQNLTGGRWQNRSGFDRTLSLQVILSGVRTQGVDVVLDDYIIAKPGEASTCNVTFANYTGKSISSIEYSYSFAGEAAPSGTGTAAVDMSSILGASANVSFGLPAISEVGEYDLTVRVTKVNGENVSNMQATTNLAVTDLDLKHRAVVEEYTGTWCGACLSGYVAMKYMAEKYPDDFIGLAYHFLDPMDGNMVLEPTKVTLYPTLFLDRCSVANQEVGPSGGDRTLEYDWLARCAVPTPAAIEVEAALSDDLETVAVTSRTAFALSGTEGYMIAYALLADGLTGEGQSWQQANNSSGGTGVTLEYDDVVILAPHSLGVAGSIPAEVTAGEWNEHKYTFTLSEAVSFYGGAGVSATATSLVQDLTKLRVVAMLLDPDGEIVNAAKCKVTVPAGVNGVEYTEEDAVEVARYSLDGRLLAEPEHGVNIVKMSDGTARKEIVK